MLVIRHWHNLCDNTILFNIFIVIYIIHIYNRITIFYPFLF